VSRTRHHGAAKRARRASNPIVWGVLDVDRSGVIIVRVTFCNGTKTTAPVDSLLGRALLQRAANDDAHVEGVARLHSLGWAA
jgi:hypothetical protein